jgi:hypothetical protein
LVYHKGAKYKSSTKRERGIMILFFFSFLFLLIINFVLLWGFAPWWHFINLLD